MGHASLQEGNWGKMSMDRNAKNCIARRVRRSTWKTGAEGGGCASVRDMREEQNKEESKFGKVEGK